MGWNVKINVRRAAGRGYSQIHSYIYVFVYVFIYLFIYVCHVYWQNEKIYRPEIRHTYSHWPYLKAVLLVFSIKSPWRPLASKNCRVTWIFRISPRLPCYEIFTIWLTFYPRNLSSYSLMWGLLKCYEIFTIWVRFHPTVFIMWSFCWDEIYKITIISRKEASPKNRKIFIAVIYSYGMEEGRG